MSKNRNYYIDFLRGLAAINIIIIHTAFWSGSSYVPSIIQSITLLLDVPFFFFLSGWSFSYVKSGIKNIKGIFSIQEKYFLFLILYTIILLIFSREEVSILNFINQFFYKRIIEPELLPVVMSSLWFLPVYVIVTGIFSFIISFINKQNHDEYYLILLMLCLIGFIYTQLGYNFLYLSRNFLFYGFFYVFGFISRNYRITNFRGLIIILFIILISIVGFKEIFNSNILIVQKLKFPPHIIYLLLSMIGIVIAIYMKGIILVENNNPIVKIGQKAIFYYFGQGISSSLLYLFVDKLNYRWYFKFLICIFINIILAIIISESLYRLYNVWAKLKNKFMNKYSLKTKLIILEDRG